MIGVVSDIHGNLEAAQRGIALLAREGAREFVLLSDGVGYGADSTFRPKRFFAACSLLRTNSAWRRA